MNDFKITNELNIRYTKLTFHLKFRSNTKLSQYKASAIRGGMGEQLLNRNCISNRKCEECDFESECIVRRTIYSKMKIKPEFMNVGDSVGYIVECVDERNEFGPWDILSFDLFIFGDTIAHAGQMIRAVIELGKVGLGTKRAQFVVRDILSMDSSQLFNDGEVDLSRIVVSTVAKYVEMRMRQISFRGKSNRLIFETALQLKHEGAFLKEYDIEILVKAAQRRIYMLDCFEGIDGYGLYEADATAPAIVEQESKTIRIPRYSSTHQKMIVLEGIVGYVQLDALEDEFILKILLAGEILHVGKLTSFGLGKYRVR